MRAKSLQTMQIVAEILPLTHPVRLGRVVVMASGWELSLLLDLLYMVCVAGVIMFFAVRRLEKRMVK